MDGKVTEVIFNTYGSLHLYWTQKWLTIGIHVYVLSKGWVDSGGQMSHNVKGLYMYTYLNANM